MRRKLAVLGAVVAVATTGLVLPAASQAATPIFPGAGYVVPGLHGMTGQLTIPSVRCMSNETDATILGIISPWIGQLEGWNATAVVGCSLGTPWYRIQTWVNAVGGAHAVAAASPGDVVTMQLKWANSSRPKLVVTDTTTNYQVAVYMNQQTSPATVAGIGGYGGTTIPNFGVRSISGWANVRPLGVITTRTRRDLIRNGITRIATGQIGSDARTFNLSFAHH